MLVAYDSETREPAITAAIPPNIGKVLTSIGDAMLRRADGVAVQATVGDPVRLGDRIETAADGQIGIRFVDGTVFLLSGGVQVMIDQLVCGIDDISRSTLSAKGNGFFAFIAGPLARTAPLRIETPIGSIVGRAGRGGFGMLSLTALAFAAMSDAKAADPDALFVDDDKISYKDLEHGTFELWTKEANPRHIIVDDPGETVVLTRKGSSVSVNQVANSAARMDELQAAQQGVLANFAKGYGPRGSSTPYFLNLPGLQPTTDDLTGEPTKQNSLQPLEFALNLPRELPIKAPPSPPILNAGHGPTEIDTVVFDTFTATHGTLSASSTNSDTLTFGISGGTFGNTVLDGITYDVSSTGAFGTLYLNSSSGAYAFVPNNDAINALKASTTQSFVVTVYDGTLSSSETFNIAIFGAEDASNISGTVTGSVVARNGTLNASPTLLVASGVLTDTDVDDPPNTFTAIDTPTRSNSGYGTFTITTSGAWTYNLDATNSAVLALNVGGVLTDTFTVTTIGGTPQVVTITIRGPLIAPTGTGPSLVLSETHLVATQPGDIVGSAPDAALTTITGNFSTAFTSAQGDTDTTISFALSINGGNGTASGLIDSQSGLADVLVLNGNTIQGRVGTTGGALAFTIAVDPTTGIVTFTEYRAVVQPIGTNPDKGEGVSLTSATVNLTATITKTDGEFQTVSLDIGGRFTITDDGPNISATSAGPALTVSETSLVPAQLTTTSGTFSTAFTSVQGGDGATISYALSITGGDGTASGLIDSNTGLADVLVLNGNTIEGRVGSTGGTLAFAITLDPITGVVTFTEYRAVIQPSGTNPDDGEGVSLTAGIVNLTATIVDKDGDFETASLDLGKQLTITDGGPSISGFEQAFVPAQNNQTAEGTYDVNFGADGASAMLVAVHSGAVGGTGYNLATSDLGGGITLVHVTGNGVDYSFYYMTHPVDGGIELDAYFTNTNGTLTDPFFKLLVDPDGTYSFDIESVEILKQITVTGTSFGASGSGTPSLTAPNGTLVITGSDDSGNPLDVKASNNGIAVGDSGLQMDPNEDLHLSFSQEQSQVSFNLTQWQGNGSVDVVIRVLNDTTDTHDFNLTIPKPTGGNSKIVVQETSNTALINTSTFDPATSTYTLYVAQTFNELQINYDHAADGNATFTVNDITYNEMTIIPSSDLLFDVSAIDADGDSATSTLQVNLQGTTAPATGTSTGILQTTGLVDSTSTDATSVTSSVTSDAVIETGSAAPASSVLTDTRSGADVDNRDNVLTWARQATKNDRSYGTHAMTAAAAAWTYAFDDAFVQLVVANSRLTQYDAAFRFASGSEKIDLTAFGALAFLHLDSTSTSVPAHTIAWIYDGARNETIAYINPTNQAVDIGDAALLEMHLHGVASLERSDLIWASASTTADAATSAIDPALETSATADGVMSSGSADYVREHAAHASNHQNFNFHFDRDMDSLEDVRQLSAGGAQAYALTNNNGDAPVAPGGSTIELRHDGAGMPAADYFAVGHGQNHASAGAIGIGDSVVVPFGHSIEHANLIAANTGAVSQPAEQGDALGNGANTAHQQGDDTPRQGASNAPHNNPHRQSDPAADKQLASVDIAHGQAGPPGNSFHFKSDLGPHAAPIVDLTEGNHTSDLVAEGGHVAKAVALTAILELAGPQPVAEEPAENAHLPRAPIDGNGPHDLIV